eukprot:12901-Heterococcus_DN1.PRE.3
MSASQALLARAVALLPYSFAAGSSLVVSAVAASSLMLTQRPVQLQHITEVTKRASCSCCYDVVQQHAC